MSPSITDLRYDDSDSRPLKRARRDSRQAGRARDSEDIHFSSPPPQALDHIFISESLVAKKPGGKKVSFRLGGFELLFTSVLLGSLVSIIFYAMQTCLIRP